MQHEAPKATPRTSLRTLPLLGALLFGGVLSFGLTSSEASANMMHKTFCQENGHGAFGCPRAGGAKGWCVKNDQIGTTGYVCSGTDPNPKPVKGEVLGGGDGDGGDTPPEEDVVEEQPVE